MLLLAALVSAWAASVESQSPRLDQVAEPASVASDASTALERGRRVFESKCYYCHGHAGDAATTAAAYLRPRPRDFTQLDALAIDPGVMRRGVLEGRPGTAMPSFAAMLSTADVDDVVEYITHELTGSASRVARYHGAAAGWGGAFPMAGDVPGGPPAARDAICLTCHESAEISIGTLRLDVVSAASPYAAHAEARRLSPSASLRERVGERLFQSNCAFCHSADGSGGNWIGTFLEPHARDLRSSAVCNRATLGRLSSIIADGLPETSMPAWRGVLNHGEIDAIAAYVRVAFCRVAAEAP